MIQVAGHRWLLVFGSPSSRCLDVAAMRSGSARVGKGLVPAEAGSYSVPYAGCAAVWGCAWLS